MLLLWGQAGPSTPRVEGTLGGHWTGSQPSFPWGRAGTPLSVKTAFVGEVFFRSEMKNVTVPLPQPVLWEGPPPRVEFWVLQATRVPYSCPYPEPHVGVTADTLREPSVLGSEGFGATAAYGCVGHLCFISRHARLVECHS